MSVYQFLRCVSVYHCMSASMSVCITVSLLCKRTNCISDKYQLAAKTYRQVVESSMADIDDFCEKNTWLGDLNRFCVQWTAEQLQQLKDAPAYVLEVS